MGRAAEWPHQWLLVHGGDAVDGRRGRVAEQHEWLGRRRGRQLLLRHGHRDGRLLLRRLLQQLLLLRRRGGLLVVGVQGRLLQGGRVVVVRRRHRCLLLLERLLSHDAHRRRHARRGQAVGQHLRAGGHHGAGGCAGTRGSLHHLRVLVGGGRGRGGGVGVGVLLLLLLLVALGLGGAHVWGGVRGGRVQQARGRGRRRRRRRLAQLALLLLVLLAVAAARQGGGGGGRQHPAGAGGQGGGVSGPVCTPAALRRPRAQVTKRPAARCRLGAPTSWRRRAPCWQRRRRARP
jgi:hypothetical protein